MGCERDPMSFQIHDGAPETPIVGRVVDKHLSDELGENLTVVVDGIDGRTHHIAGIAPERLEDARIGSVIQIGPAEATARPSDRTITAIAEDGIYRPSRHLEQAKFEGRVPGGDYEGYVDAHVRRLEALRRAGIVERIDADQWRIPEDFESRAAAYDAGRNRQASVRVLSPGRSGQADRIGRRDLARPAADPRRNRRSCLGRLRSAGARGDGPAPRASYRTGRRHAPAARPRLLPAQPSRHPARARGCPRRRGDGREQGRCRSAPPRMARASAASSPAPCSYRAASSPWSRRCHEFTLVPWRPVIDRQLGREVMGVVQGGSVSWQLGRSRSMAI